MAWHGRKKAKAAETPAPARAVVAAPDPAQRCAEAIELYTSLDDSPVSVRLRPDGSYGGIYMYGDFHSSTADTTDDELVDDGLRTTTPARRSKYRRRECGDVVALPTELFGDTFPGAADPVRHHRRRPSHDPRRD